MKSNTLQFGKAMSAALFVLLLVVVGLKNAFGQNQVATLQHADSISGVYYGQNALMSAYDAATDGDIITLSSGTFGGTNSGILIRKSITIRGAGCVLDTVINVLPTIIADRFYILVHNITVEGIWFTGMVYISGSYNSFNNFSFTKCNINNLSNSYSYSQYFGQFNNCIIKNYYSINHNGTSIINSVVRFTNYIQNDTYNPTNIYNSVIVFDSTLAINNIVAYNSIIATSSGHNVSNCTFLNCIGIETGETLLFEGQTVQNIMEVNSYEDVFETFDGIVTYENIYQLNEEIATSFLGNDGSEVGIYGGMLPYNPRPSYMVMRHCNVAPRSTVDGKLSVEIEVFTGDE